MQALRLAGAITVGVGALLLLIAQFTPIGGLDESFGGGSVKAHAYPWEAKFSASGFGDNARESQDWYDNDFDGEDGVAQLRVGAPLLVSGLALVAVGAGLQAFVRRPWGSATTGVGFLLGLAGFIVASVGVDQLFDGEQSWKAAFYLALIGLSLALVGAVLGALPERKSGGGRPPAASKPAKPAGPSY